MSVDMIISNKSNKLSSSPSKFHSALFLNLIVLAIERQKLEWVRLPQIPQGSYPWPHAQNEEEMGFGEYEDNVEGYLGN